MCALKHQLFSRTIYQLQDDKQDTALFHQLFLRLEVSSQGKQPSCIPAQHGGDGWKMEDSGQETAAPLPKEKKEEKIYEKQCSEQNQLTGELKNCSGLPCADINVLLDPDDCHEKEVCS
ncbi:hypothetical protein E2320_022527, partial [Naja naja]